jgi:hypothetical protein
MVNGIPITIPHGFQDALQAAMAAHEEAARRALPPGVQLTNHTEAAQQALSVLERQLQHHMRHTHAQSTQQHAAGLQMQPSGAQEQDPTLTQTTRTTRTSVVYTVQSQDGNGTGGTVRSEVHMSMSQTASLPNNVPNPPTESETHRSERDDSELGNSELGESEQEQIMQTSVPRGVNPYGFQPEDITEDPVTENSPQRTQFRQDIRIIQLRLTNLERQSLTVGPSSFRHVIPVDQQARQLSVELEHVCRRSSIPPNDPFAADVRRRINKLLTTHARLTGAEIGQVAITTSSARPQQINTGEFSHRPNFRSWSRPAVPQSPNPAASPTVNSSGPSTNTTSRPVASVYLLSSPDGAHSLLVPPGSSFTTGISSSIANGTRVQRAGQAADNRTRLAMARHRLAVEQARNAVQAQRRQNVRNNLGAIVRSIWLLVRLFFFIWFFGLGGTWTRTILMLAVCSIIFLAHAGVFAPLREWWNPIREHLEGLVPLAVDNGRNEGRPDAGAQGDATGVQRAGEPNPQETANRLLREQQARDGNWIRGNLRRVERAVALFMATLVPGVGERHIRARNAAEAARITEERQAEGQGRQREQPETEGETEHEQGSADAGIGSNAEDTNTTTPPTNEPPAAQVGIEG